jgi:hypothetical protein
VNRINEAQQAVEIVRLALKTTQQAVESELRASGTSVVEPTAPVPQKAWA